MKGTVLLADKLDSLRQPLAAALMERGLKVLHASNRGQALGQADKADVILLGRNLTEENSLDVIRELRERPETRNTPVIVHTPAEDKAYEEKALEAGAQAVLKRPFDYDALFAQIQRLCPAGRGERRPLGGYVHERNEQEIVRFLGGLLAQGGGAVTPQYDPQSPLGYTYGPVEESFGLSSGEAVKLLDDLVAEGVLERRLVDKVHLCPSCGWHTLNFVEVCPRDGSMDIGIEQIIHHFSCAYVGPWSEFKQGADLVCPKCDERLRHMGLDYEKPSDTYICRDCGYIFNDSAVEAHCFHCEHVTVAEEIGATHVYAYAPNAKTSRAVEYGRLYGLDIQSVLFEGRSRTFRRDYLIYEIDREIYRARRYKSPLSLVLVSVEGLRESPGVRDSVGVSQARRELFETVADTLRDLDVVSALGDGLAAILLPETDLEPAVRVAERVQRLTAEFQAVNMENQLSVTAAVAQLLEEHSDGMEFFDYAHRALLWALKNRPGSIVSAQTWQKETGHA